jgi:glycosyltransferase involved in cell wall biosynthesis
MSIALRSFSSSKARIDELKSKAGDRSGTRPRISVVIPTYNRASLVLEAVLSVISQTFGDWELIVVDDGSTDDTIDRLEAIGEPRLRVIRQSHLGNVARLRNLGAAAARGEYLAFLDSDDLWLPSKLEVQLHALSESPGAWCYTDHALIDSVGEPTPTRAGRFSPVSGRIARQLIGDETGASVITWLVPRTLFDQAGGFDERLSLLEDLDLALRLAEIADAVAVPEVLSLARDHQGRKTRSVANPHRQSASIFEKAAMGAADPVVRRLARGRRARHLASAGEHLIAAGNVPAGLASVGRALFGGAGLYQCGHALASGLWRLLRPKKG